MSNRIMIIDDEEAIRFSLSEGLSDLGFHVTTAKDAEEGWNKIDRYQPQLIFLDIRLPRMNGVELLEKIRREFPTMIVIMMTAYGDTKSTVSCIKKGAYDYINKPFDMEEIYFMVEQVFQKEKLEKEARIYRKQQEDFLYKDKFIGKSKVMREVFDKINTVASTTEDTTVLIEGETGTGKELVACSIHLSSERKNQPFIDINCGSIPESLLESELFGYEKNAFTGAAQTKKGLIELADGGTLFLDEIGELPFDMQGKLLRFLETKKIKRVGGHKDIAVNIRIIAATNRNLNEEMKCNRFRKDLYYRLHVFPILLPPLRERKEDIETLANYFLSKFTTNKRIKCTSFTKEVIDKFKVYHWPGNVRELRNVIERVTLLYHNHSTIDVQHLPDDILVGSLNKPAMTDTSVLSKVPSGHLFNRVIEEGLNEVLQEQEKMYLKKLLEMTQWNISKTAELSGMSRHALKRRIDKYFPKYIK